MTVVLGSFRTSYLKPIRSLGPESSSFRSRIKIGVQNGPGAGTGRGSLGLATGLLLHPLAEAVAFAVHLEYLAVMRQTIQQRRRHSLALKDLPPVAEREVARDQQALPLVSAKT